MLVHAHAYTFTVQSSENRAVMLLTAQEKKEEDGAAKSSF